MQVVTDWFNLISSWVWGPVMLVLLVGTGVFYTIRLGGLQFRLLPRALKLAFARQKASDAPGDISPFQALMTALAGTIGTGNIAGVATAVVLGGPGAVFWMWLSALVGMATKYQTRLLRGLRFLVYLCNKVSKIQRRAVSGLLCTQPSTQVVSQNQSCVWIYAD